MEENEERITYLINKDYSYIINSQMNGAKTFYKIPIKKKGFDGQEIKTFLPVKFAKCQPVPNGTIIRIKNAMEDFYVKNRYDVIVCLVIFDYEIIKHSDYAAKQAIQEFNEADVSEEDLPF